MRMRKTLACVLLLLLLAGLAAAPMRTHVARERAGDEAEIGTGEAGSAAAVAGDVAAPAETADPTLGYRGRVGSRRAIVAPAHHPEPAPRSAVELTLRWLARHANPDGSWGQVAEPLEGGVWTTDGATAVAVLALLGAGYTHSSRESWAGVQVGPLLARALEWMSDRQPGDAHSLALTAAALSEAWGLSNAEALRPPAERALERLVQRQLDDGSWGDPDLSPWAALALASAACSGLDVPASARDRAQAWFSERLEAGGSPPDLLGWMLLSHGQNHPASFHIMRASTHALPSPDSFTFTSAYLGSLAAFRFDGPGGPVDKRWVQALHFTLARRVQEDGGWDGDTGTTSAVVRNALGTLSLERYYAYANVSGVKGKPEDPLPPLPMEPEPDPGQLSMGEDAPEFYEPERDPDSLRMGDDSPAESE